MDFRRLQQRLLDLARQRIRNGELTERALARRAGISQPHLHNALKGVRALSPELADRVLTEMGLTILDLLGESEAAAYRALGGAELPVRVDVLDAPVGPGLPWPERLRKQPAKLPRRLLEGMRRPLVIRLADDPDLDGFVVSGQMALLETAEPLWSGYSEAQWYAVAMNGEGLIRRFFNCEGVPYLVGRQGSPRGEWRPLTVAPDQLPAILKGRVAVLDLGMHLSPRPTPDFML